MIELRDDGTMDTVVGCSECGHEMRFNFDPGPDEEGFQDYDDFIDECIETMEEEHECDEDVSR